MTCPVLGQREVATHRSRWVKMGQYRKQYQLIIYKHKGLLSKELEIRSYKVKEYKQ
jgi:hypothetical protein